MDRKVTHRRVLSSYRHGVPAPLHTRYLSRVQRRYCTVKVCFRLTNRWTMEWAQCVETRHFNFLVYLRSRQSSALRGPPARTIVSVTFMAQTEISVWRSMCGRRGSCSLFDRISSDCFGE